MAQTPYLDWNPSPSSCDSVHSDYDGGSGRGGDGDDLGFIHILLLKKINEYTKK